ncbi:hypothetical protein TNCV_2099031 [Trichonephila clavipes]|nr:hypothetical protein TNCV_2099031 [Trichonephila clavipes]
MEDLKHIEAILNSISYSRKRPSREVSSSVESGYNEAYKCSLDYSIDHHNEEVLDTLQEKPTESSSTQETTNRSDRRVRFNPKYGKKTLYRRWRATCDGCGMLSLRENTRRQMSQQCSERISEKNLKREKRCEVKQVVAREGGALILSVFE